MSQPPLIASRTFMAFFFSHFLGVWLGTLTTSSAAQNFDDTGISFVGLSEASAVWGDYDNDGDLDVVVCGFDAQSTPRTILYRNDGDNRFTPVDSGLPNLGRGSIAWGDYDNDGNLDILLIGVSTSGQSTVSYIYHNDGGGTFHLATPLVPSDGSTAVSWADFNNDGRLDALSGSLLYRNDGAGNFVSKGSPAASDIHFSSSAWADYDNDGNFDMMWTGRHLDNGFDVSLSAALRNDGNGNFSCCPIALNGVTGNAAWGDFNNDGNEDILIAGTNRLFHFILTQIFRNQGNGTFDSSPVDNTIPSVYRGSVVWGDFDGDGDLDVLLAGLISTGQAVCRLYQNQGPSGFVLVEYPLAGIYDGSATFADYDNDGRLDIFCIGNSSNGPIARLYHNVGGTANSPPNAPTDLVVSVLGNTASFTWTAGADANQSGGHTFNLRVGTGLQAGDVVNPMASAAGFRRVVQIGNTDERQSRSITNLAPGRYYWSIQAIDNSYSGSPFAAEQSFTVKNVPKIAAIQNQRTVVNVPTSEISFVVSDVETPATDLIVSASSSNTSLVPNQNIVFGGFSSNRTITVFPATNEIGTTTITLTVTDTDNAEARSSFVLHVDQFREIAMHLPGLVYSSVAWGDFDNDGDLDLLVTGSTFDPAEEPVFSRIYRNDGNGIFTDIKAGFPGVLLGTAVWGDSDNDGYLDVLLTGSTNGSYLSAITRIYRNKGDSKFTDIGASVSGGYRGVAAWGDYDNDGRLDFILFGAEDPYRGSTQIYRNEGSNHFAFAVGIPSPIKQGSVAWADFDNDGYLDILLTGAGPDNFQSLIYRNNRNGSFDLVDAGLPGHSITGSDTRPDGLWVDFDQDGDLDILLPGFAGGTNYSHIYRNDGNGLFTGFDVGLAQTLNAMGAWGDYDADGDLDLALFAQYSTDGSGVTSHLYRNDGGGKLSEVEANLTPAIAGGAAWGDYDNDGRLDLSVTGFTDASHGIASVYHNEGTRRNVPPSSPANLRASVTTNEVTLIWDPGTDGETSRSNGLSYQVRVGRSPGGIDVVSPNADPSIGLRRLPTLTPLAVTNRWVLRNLAGGTHYWSVQSIDTALAGSPFAQESTFYVNGRPVISEIPSQTFGFDKPSPPIDFTIGDLETAPSNLVLVATSSNTNLVPAANISFSGFGTNRTMTIAPVTNQVGSATITITVMDEIGQTTSWSFVVSFLPFLEVSAGFASAGQSPKVAWGDYDNDGDLDLVLTGTLSSGAQFAWIYRNDGNGRFHVAATNLPGVAYGSVAWGDYDNDGDLDLVITGRNNNTNLIAAIFRNDGNDTFTDIHADLPGVVFGTVVWADYDNDGDLDLLLSGSTSTQAVPKTQLFRNDGGNTFTPVQSTLPNLFDSSAAWGDIDNDGDLDLLLGGLDASFRWRLNFFRNLGGGVFTNDLPSLTPIDIYSVSLADLDNDGDLDASVAGLTRVYRNAGTNGFTALSVGLPPSYGGRAAWGDYDNDGRPEVLLVGSGLARVYRNNPDGTFTDISAALAGVQEGDAAWGDFDGDGNLDVLLAGIYGGSTKLYRNQTLHANSPPASPPDLIAVVSGRRVMLSWSPGTDANQTNGLSYNLRVGTSPGSENVMSAMADGRTGRRRLPQLGNASLSTRWALNDLPVGMYFWSVQAIDNSFAASTFSAEQTFVIAPAANEPPLIQSARLLPGGGIALTLIGSPGTDYAIDISADLALWTQWRVVQSSNALITIGDSDVVLQGSRFYRARQSR